MPLRYPLIIQCPVHQQVVASQGETAPLRVQFRIRQRDLDGPALAVKRRERDAGSLSGGSAGGRLGTSHFARFAHAGRRPVQRTGSIAHPVNQHGRVVLPRFFHPCNSVEQGVHDPPGIVRSRLDYLCQRRLRQGLQAVAGQHDQVAVLKGITVRVHIHQRYRLAVNNRAQLVHPGVVAGFFFGQPAQLYQVLQQRAHGVVGVQPVQAALPEQPQYGIADAGPIQRRPDDQRRDQGGAHF